MAFKPPAIPQSQWDAAATFGKAVALGLIETQDAVSGLSEAAVKAGYTGDLIGLRVSLSWQVDDMADYWRRERDRTDALIRKSLAPLIDAREPAARILAEAHRVNEERGEPFAGTEVRRIAEEVLSEAMARIDRFSRQKGRRNAR